MTFTQSIMNRVAGFMKNKGFQRNGKCFFRTDNHLAFCVEFDYPGSLLYVTFYIIPLYIPSDGRYYTYGNRLNAHNQKTLPLINTDTSEEQKLNWVQSFEKAINEYVLPYFQKVYSPPALADYCCKSGNLQEHMHSTPIQQMRLLLHTYAHLRDQQSFEKTERTLRKEMQKCSYLSSSVLEKYSAEIDVLKHLFCLSQAEFDAYQRKTIAETTKKCFG